MSAMHRARTFRHPHGEVSVVLYGDTISLLSPKLDTEPQLNLPVFLALRVFWFVLGYWILRRWCGLRSSLERQILLRQLGRADKDFPGQS